MIIDHKSQTESGKDREEHWIHIILGMLKSEFPAYYKDRKPTITKTGNNIKIKGLNIDKEIKTEREIRVNDILYKYNILLKK